MFFIVLLFLWNDKECAHAIQGEQTAMLSFLTVVVHGNRRNSRGGQRVFMRLFKVNERDVMYSTKEDML